MIQVENMENDRSEGERQTGETSFVRDGGGETSSFSETHKT